MLAIVRSLATGADYFGHRQPFNAGFRLRFAELVSHFPVLGSNPGCPVFRAIFSDWRPCWPFGTQAIYSIFADFDYVHQERITICNDDIFFV